jgi:PKD repeat protein
MPPHIVYNEAGDWDVTLIVDDGVNSDSVTIENYIHTGFAPLADFVADEVVITAGNSTNFNSLSTGDDLVFEWTFEGGTPGFSDEENPMDIFYLIPDWATYDVTLVVTNPFGSDTLTKEDYIEVVPVSVDEIGLNARNVSLYPNPNNGIFTVSVPGTAQAELNILDIHGKSIWKERFSGTQAIQPGNLNKGVYLVKILDVDSGSIVVKRLLIK